MKISNEDTLRTAQISPVRPTNLESSATDGSDTATVPTSAATVSFSAAANDMSNAKAAIDDVPAERVAFVNSLKQQVEAGTYHVSSSDIADKIMQSAIADSQL